MKPPIFIVGPHRAGSTVWHNLVSMCPGVLRLGEPWFIGPPRYRDFRYFLKSQVGDLTTDENVILLVELSLSKKQLPGIDNKFWRFEGMSEDEMTDYKQRLVARIMGSDRSLKEIVRAYLEEILAMSGKNRICMKFPVDVANVPDLIEWFPECRVMHLTRDPRGLAMSKTNDPSGTAIKVRQHPKLAWAIRKSAIAFVTREYGRLSRLHQKFKGLENYRLFRYEDLLAEPEKTAEALCEFIGEPYSRRMLELEKGEHEHQPSSLTGQQVKALDPSAAIRWKSKISPLDSWFIGSLARGSMQRFDYDPDHHPIFRHG